MSVLGPQYAKDDPFKARARLHQSRFRAEVLGHAAYRDYGNRLSTEDALAGGNFYTAWPELWNRVKRRYPLGDTRLYWDMLRSEHMPFNLFLPLDDERGTLSRWVTVATGDDVNHVRRVLVEFAPAPKAAYLDDNSFDAYVEYEAAGRAGVCGIGVEVKYTEGAYDYGKQERARMFAPDSPYHRVHRQSGIYEDGTIESLRSKSYKQVWRNHLLGEAMVQRDDLVRFTSLLLFPEANQHFVDVVREYPKLLRQTARNRFVGQTLQEFVGILRSQSDAPRVTAWLDYLERRYLHP